MLDHTSERDALLLSLMLVGRAIEGFPPLSKQQAKVARIYDYLLSQLNLLDAADHM
jgi:hypothetical protein